MSQKSKMLIEKTIQTQGHGSFGHELWFQGIHKWCEEKGYEYGPGPQGGFYVSDGRPLAQLKAAAYIGEGMGCVKQESYAGSVPLKPNDITPQPLVVHNNHTTWEYMPMDLWDLQYERDRLTLLNSFGKLGWELVSVDNEWAYFKRPVNRGGQTNGK